jgi:hypothetical protein
VPTINWAGAERARGEWMFHLQVGSHEDESLVMARHIAAIGKRRLGVVYDRSPIGTRHFKYLIDEARVIGIEIVAAEAISPLDEGRRLRGRIGARQCSAGWHSSISALACPRRRLRGRWWPRLAGAAHHEHGRHARLSR